MYLEDSLVTSWLSPLPKLLWELGGSAPHVSAAALVLLLDAARFAAPGKPPQGVFFLCRFYLITISQMKFAGAATERSALRRPW